MKNNELVRPENLETKEKPGPKISVKIFYSPHETREDMEGLTSLLQEADIYIPEGTNWTPAGLKVYRDVAGGKEEPQAALAKIVSPINPSRMARLAQLEALYNSHKPTIFIDLPRGHPLLEKVSSAEHLPKYAGSFQEYLKAIKRSLKENAETHKEREQYMVTQLPLKIEELLQEIPQLRKKDKIKVLLSLGSVHTGLFYSLKQAGIEVSRVFGSPLGYTQEYMHADEAGRSYMFGKKVDDLLAAQAVLEVLIGDVFDQTLEEVTNKTNKRHALLRELSSKFSLEEIGDIFQRWNALERIVGQGQVRLRLKTILEEKFQEKGVKVPENEKELDEILSL